MTALRRLVLGFLAAPVFGAAGVGAQVPAPVARRVTQLVSQRWQVPASRVRLVWRGVADVARADTAGAGLELLPGQEGGGWFTLVVPVRAPAGVVRWSVRAGVAEHALVAAHDLPRRAAIGVGDAVDSVIVRWGAPNRTVAAQMGWVTHRPVRAGEVLDAPTVEPPPLIGEGDPVQLVWARGRIQLTLTGVAIGRTQALGQPARVRLADGRTLSGVAIGPDRIRAVTN